MCEVSYDLKRIGRADKLRVDHGYDLSSALTSKFPALRGNRYVLIDLLQGGVPLFNSEAGDDGDILIEQSCQLRLRIPTKLTPSLRSVNGSDLRVRGMKFHVSVDPRIEPIMPQPVLYSNVVIFKNNKEQVRDPEAFVAQFNQEMEWRGYEGTVLLRKKHEADRPWLQRSRSIKRKPAVKHWGFACYVVNMSPETSIGLQSYGLGKLRKQGAGWFRFPDRLVIDQVQHYL